MSTARSHLPTLPRFDLPADETSAATLRVGGRSVAGSEAAGLWTWEQAVAWLRAQPEHQELVRACYFDDPLLAAARRFAASEEWQAVRAWLPESRGPVLDLGAGRGISSYALACDGWQVTAVEPDPSPLVGTAAIRELARQAGLAIRVVQVSAESLPLRDESFDVVYGRQVLHHARDVTALCCEAARVLRPGGRFLATREHVISRPSDLAEFLDGHPLHRLCGGERAYLLGEYRAAIRAAGLRLLRVLGPYDSVINYFPETYAQWLDRCTRRLARYVGRRLATRLGDERHVLGRRLLRLMAAQLSRSCRRPGRLYSFVARRMW